VNRRRRLQSSRSASSKLLIDGLDTTVASYADNALWGSELGHGC
jgi:hypothetical protein